MPTRTHRLVVALGGNALIRRGEAGTIEQQTAHAAEAMGHVAELVRAGHRVAVTHGNGPIVGNIVIRNESARDRIPPMPLYIDDADSQGGIGLMLQLSLHNRLRALGLDTDVVTVVTAVVVDPADPAFARPTKPIGPYYTAEELAAISAEEPAWVFREIPECGWRRVVASPAPRRIVEADSVGRILEMGDVAIAAGGGGVPVEERPDGTLCPLDAVVDKDASSALLGCQLDADTLAICMEADRVYVGWGTPAQRALGRLCVSDARRYLENAEFDEGSMAPKVAAAARFAEECGRIAVICRSEELAEALEGRAGTVVEPD